jgi:hypothetical protein
MKKIIKGSALLIAVIMVVMLAACGADSGSSGIPENPGNIYRVIVQDESGAGVKGARVQFCSDIECTMAETDENGIASFEDFDEGSYTVHVLTVPEGFENDSTEYEAPETYGDVTITLKAA